MDPIRDPIKTLSWGIYNEHGAIETLCRTRKVARDAVKQKRAERGEVFRVRRIKVTFELVG